MITRTIIEYLVKSAENHPDKIAFADENKKITFSELLQEAQKLAYYIELECNNIKNKPVAVCMPKSVDSIIAFLGIVLSGNFYCPIDTSMPMNRIDKICEVLQPMAYLYVNGSATLFQVEGKTLFLSNVPSEYNSNVLSSHLHDSIDENPLYVLFTSGSTGQPKGVVINHRSVIDYIEWLEDKFAFDTGTIFGNQAPFYFDNSILDIYCTLKCAATMYIIPEKLFVFPKALLQFMFDKEINTIFWVPSALISVANSGALEEIAIPTIKKILFCGEVMPNKQLNIWRKVYENCLYANLYGPTEITDVCTYYIVDRVFSDDEPLPIGVPCENTEILVLNEQNQLVKEGEVGELCVRGTCLSLGYFSDFEKTIQVFTQNPLHNLYRDLIYRTGDIVKYNQYHELIYMCRKDFQIKHQGHRIELGEIESIAAIINGISQSVALYDDERKNIVLFCSLTQNISDKEIYMELKGKLPKYMMPGKIIIIDKFPLNLNGKIDRLELRKRF